MADDTARAWAYPAGVAVRPASAVAAAAAAVVAAAAVLPSRPGAKDSAVGRHTGRPGTADITVPPSPPPPGRGSKGNGMSDVGDLAPVTVLWGLMAFTAHTFMPAKRQNRGDHQDGHQADTAYDERRAHKQRLRRFACAAYREKHALARRFAAGIPTARQASKVCELVVLAVAWTLCDLAGRDSPSHDDVTTALSFRQAGGT
jgi:hypothetical protein